jgi:uncharacterized protein YdhG (YjbR/CyaY superfamily)
MTVIDKYLANVAEPQRAELERIRKIVVQAVPEAIEVITYGMPGFKYKSKYLISFAPFKNHLSIFPGGESVGIFSSELSPFKTSKGTVQFTTEKPLSEELLKKITLQRKNSIDKAHIDV